MIKHVGDRVILERKPMEQTHLDMEISERAKVKNHIAVVLSCENDKYAGKEVHVPHYGVTDTEFDGADIAITKFERLFAVKEGEAFRPVNRYVKVLKCIEDHVRDESGEIALYMTENFIEDTNWVEILEVADDCESMRDEYVGMYFPCPEDDERLARIGYSDEFCVHEDLINFVTEGD